MPVDTIKAEIEQADWIDEFAKKNRPMCPSCERPMKRAGNKLWGSGEFRTFSYQCWWCKCYKRITVAEKGYHAASEVTDGNWADRFYDVNRPWCCGQPMRKYKVRVWEPTGAWSFTYKCPHCRQQKTVKTYEDRSKPNPALEALDPTRIDELIRSRVGDKDIIQDAWVAVLEQGATTEDKVIELADATLRAGRHAIIADEHSGERLGSLYADSEHGEDGPKPLDRVVALGIEMTIPLEDEVVDELMRCPHCGNTTTLVKAGTRTDGKGERQRWMCRACWKSTLHPRVPKREQGKVHIGKIPEDGLVDVSALSRIRIAEKVRCSREYVSMVLCGHTIPKIPLFYDIAKAAGCSMDGLFKAITGANGQNPYRLKYKKPYRSKAVFKAPPKYTVNGRGYPSLYEALLSLNISPLPARWVRNYNALPPEIKAQIVRSKSYDKVQDDKRYTQRV